MKKDKNKTANAPKTADKKEAQNNPVTAGAVQSSTEPEYKLNIPENEIWTYQIEGLQPPHIGKPYTHAKLKMAVVIVTLVIAISLAIYLSVRAVHSEKYQYEQLDNGTYELIRFSNPGDITDLTIDYVRDENDNPDKNNPITVIHEYAVNCDDKILNIRIGADVEQIDGKAFYTCNYLQTIKVDENNPNFCDIDGVLYTKDLKRIICYPIDHDTYLRDKYGYDEEILPNNEDTELYEKYNKEVRTYVLPSVVEEIGKLCFSYADIADVYMPEGVKTIETMAFFKIQRNDDNNNKKDGLENIYTYTVENENTDTSASSLDTFESVYVSFPNTLEYIGSDAFSYNRELSYVYIPSSVTYIGHHAFWDTCSNKSGELKGVVSIQVESDEDTFKKTTKTGDQWRPQYDFLLFKKSVDVNYSAERNNNNN